MQNNMQFIISRDTNSNTFTGWNGLLVRKYQFITNVLQDFLPRSSLLRKTKQSQKYFCFFPNAKHMKSEKKNWYWEENEHHLTCLNKSNKINSNKRSNEQKHWSVVDYMHVRVTKLALIKVYILMGVVCRLAHPSIYWLLSSVSKI